MATVRGILSNKVALICGAGRPEGRAAAVALAAAGAKLALHDLTPVHVEETIRAILPSNAYFRSYINDTAKGLPVQALMDEVLTDFGRLDVLVHAIHAAPSGELLSLDEWDWQHSLEINLNGPFLLTQAAAEVMRQQGGGTILHVLAAGEQGNSLALVAAQAALEALVRQVAPELMTYNINCHAIEAPQPGATQVQDWQDLLVSLCSPAAMRLAGQRVRPGDM